MKKIFTLIILASIALSVLAQQSTRAMTWDAIERAYIEYVPTIYDGSTPAPVVFCLHGLGDNMTNFTGVGFHSIANETGWIVITPQALMASVDMIGEIGTAWNSGAGAEGTPLGTIILNEDVDDTGFLLAILDSLENNFNINTDSIFFTGFSMGGFMSNRMGIEFGDRINAIASVSGTIGIAVTDLPTANINTLHFHGTADTQITYDDAGFDTGAGIYSVGTGAEETVEYWRSYNNCDVSPTIITMFPDTHTDGKTFERYLYQNGDNDSYTAFIKVIEGDHEWYYTPQNDIDYASEIYKFFTNTMDFPTDINNNVVEKDISIFPNPAQNFITVKVDDNQSAKLVVYDILGSKIISKDLNNKANVVSIQDLPEGMYIFRVTNNNKTTDSKVIINR